MHGRDLRDHHRRPGRAPELLDRVARGEEITSTRHGRPAAASVAPGALRARRAEAVLTDAAELSSRLAAARVRPMAGSGGVDERWADELISDIRRGRER
jgi:antitoxin (DNA-binding transcriptional repressor) of toxin-antitoxin stability system